MYTLFADHKKKDAAELNNKCSDLCKHIFSKESFLIDSIMNYYSSLDSKEARKFFITKLTELHHQILKTPPIKNACDLHKFAYLFSMCFEYKVNPNNSYDHFLWFDKQNQLYPNLLSLFLMCVNDPEFHTSNPIFTHLAHQDLSLFMLLMRNFSFFSEVKPEYETVFLHELSKINKVDFNEQNNIWGNTWLHFMISNANSGDCIRFLKTLISFDKVNLCNLNVNVLSKAYGTAPLHLAVAKGYRNVDSEGKSVFNFLYLVGTLIEAHADVNLKTAKQLSKQMKGLKLKLVMQNLYSEHTPLHIACARRDLEMIHILIKYGADPDIKNAQGLTALDVFHLPYVKRKELVDSISGEGLNNFINYEKEHATPEHIALCEEALIETKKYAFLAQS